MKPSVVLLFVLVAAVPALIWGVGPTFSIPTATATSDGNEWTVPIGLGISRTTVFNRRPISQSAQYYYDVEGPDGAAGEQLRLAVSFLFPR
jgi:hypothetical protein